MTPTFTCEAQTDNGVSIDFNGATMTVTTSSFTTPSILSYNITVNDGETTFTQPFGLVVTGTPTAIQPVWSEEGIEVASREFFTLDGRQVTEMQSGEVYMMKVTATDGSVHTVKIIKN